MAVDVSSSSPSFRELDDVFLQSQARIWLGEVLHTRFDEQLSICDLLSDGELLFEVSKALWNMLLVKYMELKSYKACMLVPVDTRKSSGRYRPYSNVDSFLKVCKVLGLTGVDLFSPSDVVEKRDTRKVCICIRSLSKKARSKQLNVPDFDIVTNTVAMPTDVVRCIRRSLESCTSIVTHGQSEHAKPKLRKVPLLHVNERMGFEESDEEQSNFSDTSYADFVYLDARETVDDKYMLTKGLQEADTRNQGIGNFAHTPGSAESLILQYVSGDDQLEGISFSSPVCESRLVLSDEFTTTNHGKKFWHDNGENALTPLNMGKVDHHISISDMISFKILTNVPFNISDDVEASPTSSMSSVMGRVLDFDFDFDAKSGREDLRALVPCTPDLQQGEAAKRLNDKLSGLFDQSEQEISELSSSSSSPCWDDAKLIYCSVDQDLESQNRFSWTQKSSLLLLKDNVTDINADSIQENMVCKGLNGKLIKGANRKSNYKVDGVFNDHVAPRLSETCDWVIENHHSGNVKKEDDLLCTNQSDDVNVHCHAEDRTKDRSKDERNDGGSRCLVEANTNGRNDKRTVNMEKKRTYIAPLFKTVAKGTALIGILFLLQLRRNNGAFSLTLNSNSRNRSDRNTKNNSSEIHWKSSGVGLSRRKGEKGSKIYPVEKFKFGD